VLPVKSAWGLLPSLFVFPCHHSLPASPPDLNNHSTPTSTAPQSCELLQGNLVRFSTAPQNSVPTAVLVHGILGSRRNLHSFARMILQVSAAPDGLPSTGGPSGQLYADSSRCMPGYTAI
jgi:hypothetical protein